MSSPWDSEEVFEQLGPHFAQNRDRVLAALDPVSASKLEAASSDQPSSDVGLIDGLARLLSARDPKLRLAAALEFRYVQPSALSEEMQRDLYALTQHESSSTRVAALIALADLETQRQRPEARSAAAARLGDPSADVRLAAVVALRSLALSDPHLNRSLVRLAETDPSPLVQRASRATIEALARIEAGREYDQIPPAESLIDSVLSSLGLAGEGRTSRWLTKLLESLKQHGSPSGDLEKVRAGRDGLALGWALQAATSRRGEQETTRSFVHAAAKDGTIDANMNLEKDRVRMTIDSILPGRVRFAVIGRDDLVAAEGIVELSLYGEEDFRATQIWEGTEAEPIAEVLESGCVLAVERDDLE